jgi:LysM repeat protein
MRWLPWVLLFISSARAAEVPAGTLVSVRLTDAVSTGAPAIGQRVRAVVIEPVTVAGQVLIAPHTQVSGQVKAAVSAAKAERQQARLSIQFDRIDDAPLHAEVANVDNARETVDEHGAILGIVPKDTLEGLAERGIGKLSQSQTYNQLAEILLAAKEALVKPVDPEISFGPGTEFTLRLTKGLSVKAPQPFAAPPTFPHVEQIAQMVTVLPFITYAANPPEPSDVTNLVFIGYEAAVTKAFADAGWSAAQELSEVSKFEAARALIESRGYKEAPVSLLLLDRRAPAFVYQKSLNSFAMRHHLRIWRMPGTFNGVPVWSCSATHDSGIDLSQETFTFVHRIDSNIDRERQKVIDDLVFTGDVSALSLVDRAKAPRSFRNATGDAVVTDGRVAVLGFEN